MRIWFCGTTLAAIMFGLALPGVASAGDDDFGCTLATLRGQYMFAGAGTLIPPAFGVTETSPAASAGYHIFNGDGTGTDYVTFTVNGAVVPVTSPTPVAYTLEPDCTGTYTVISPGQPPGPHFNIFVAVDGSELSVIETDAGAALAEGPDRRVRSSR